jgi:hypothetical protein
MAQSIGPVRSVVTPTRGSLEAAKKKGCKQHKCSKWKGGKCRCGRD